MEELENKMKELFYAMHITYSLVEVKQDRKGESIFLNCKFTDLGHPLMVCLEYSEDVLNDIDKVVDSIKKDNVR